MLFRSPNVVVQNMPGGGSLRLANFMYEAAPRDGTQIGTFARATPFAPLIGQQGANFDGTKFGWLGSMTDETSVCIAWRTSGFARLEEAKTRELVLSATSPSDDAVQIPKLLNNLFGMRFRIVTGYPGNTEMLMAIERGETQGRCGMSWMSFKASHKRWLDEDKVRVFVQVAMRKHSDLSNVPLLAELTRNEEERQIVEFYSARQEIARPFFTPPGAPAGRIAALREAFMKTMADPAFLAEAEKGGLEINAFTGERVEALVRDIYKIPRDIAKKAAELAGE